MKDTLSKILFLILLSGFAACQEVAIVHDLQERDANEILVILAKSGMQASKEKFEKNQEVTWIVKVKPADEMNARNILVANRLPRVRHGGLSGICKDAGLIPTPKTEKCREILGYKGEIINLLENISGVVSADIVLNIPDKDEFPDENNPVPRPTASVTVQYLSGTDASGLTEGKIQQIVANSIPGLDTRDVTVIMSLEQVIPFVAGQAASTVPTDLDPTTAATSPPNTATATEADVDLATIGGLKMDAASAQKFKIVAIVFLVLFLLLTVSFILVLLKLARVKKQASSQIVAVDDEEGGQGADKKLLHA